MEIKDIVEIVLAIVLVLLTRYAVPYLKTLLQGEKNKDLIQLIDQLVSCAEQIYKGSKKGEMKKKYVCDILNDKGVVVDGEVNAMIEAAVYNIQGSGGGSK